MRVIFYELVETVQDSRTVNTTFRKKKFLETETIFALCEQNYNFSIMQK